MRYLALATDYDGTLAHDGVVPEAAVDALRRLRDTGRKLIMVTGRELDQLMDVFPELDLFDWVVAENGPLLYRPSDRTEVLLGPEPDEEFVRMLRDRGVAPLSVGRIIVATVEPNEKVVLQTIHDLGLELQVIFNKGAVMVLPSGMNKATGLLHVLRDLGLSPHNVVGVGDAENDHAFLGLCEASVAVANALVTLQERCDHVTDGARGHGVRELIDEIIDSDLADLSPRLNRHHIPLGTDGDGRRVALDPHGSVVLLAAPSGSGKSTLATAFVEGLSDTAYQFCLIDPEGDYETFEGAVVLGDPDRPPSADEVMQLLEDPTDNAVVNLTGLSLHDRPGFFTELLPRLQKLRAQAGRPHWIVIDEAHHLLPASRDGPAESTLPMDLGGTLMITVHPERIAPTALHAVTDVLTVGDAPRETVSAFAASIGQDPPGMEAGALDPGHALRWSPDGGHPVVFRMAEPRVERRRHRRKYAAGELVSEEHFVFTGPDGKLNLRAQNLMIFLQMADGVDDDTWTFHLRRGEYSRWFRRMIKDQDLAAKAEKVEQDDTLAPEESRTRIREAVEEGYTLPA
ncbi:MAG: HAD-IIB family hydrolase [Actinomycetota bacterium]|nr:HAD-IIB family hydrolase [Actinomycetota bacterium]